ncbi:MAG: hypothetical protein FJ253_08180 [Phycisphaerae bacterium]|nr:hypothetical protein [Phycisphaerae bacterium]
MSTVAPSNTGLAALTQFTWEPQPAAQALVNDLIESLVARSPEAERLSTRMLRESGTRFLDWVDSIEAPRTPELRERLRSTGWSPKAMAGAPDCWINERGIFPRIALSDGPVLKVGIKVECVGDFVQAHRLFQSPVIGEALGQFRAARACRGEDAEVWAIERHGWLGFSAPVFDPVKAAMAEAHRDRLRRRRRDFPEDELGFRLLHQLLDEAIADIGRDWTCDIFFSCEREHWQRRNRAAQVQWARQDRLGMGWANHDHHTYRCARENFTLLVATWEKLGFTARERFYAGHEAGWGAQVMEHPVTGITTFNDVDLSPEELVSDFAHEPLPARRELGTVGLWCALHGDSILQAGMHHLEATFDFEALVDQLDRADVRTMSPFTTFPWLKQAFTEGERWPVAEERLQRLIDKGLITAAQAAVFRHEGALGSHLENLERNDGFKGFNQQGVSDIIARTDPRHQAALVLA